MITTTVYFRVTKNGIEQHVIIDGQRVPLRTLKPGDVFKRTGRPPLWYPHHVYGWLYLKEAVEC